MRILNPYTVDDAKLTAINVPEDDYLEWDNTTTFARGDYIISTTTHTVYRSIVDGNIGNDPDIEVVAIADPLVDDPDPVNWQVMGATNRWRLFDKKPSQPCIQADSVSFTIESGEFIAGIAGFDIVADSIQVRVLDESMVEIYNKTIEMTNESGVTDWLEYFIAPYTPRSEFVFTDLPILGTPTLIFEALGTEVSIGQIVLGEVWKIGTSVSQGAGFSGLDFSFVETDDFGNLATVKRAATRISDFSAVVGKDFLSDFDFKMRSLRGGKPAVWIGSENPDYAAINYGFVRSYSVPYTTALHSIVDVEIQGIV